MTASVPDPAGAPAQEDAPWSRLAELDRLLQAAGLPTGADRWQNAQDLIASLAARRQLPADPGELRPLLAPLFSRSPEEQRRFAELFDTWLGGRKPLERLSPAPPPVPRPAPPRPPPRTRLLPVSLGALARALVVARGG